MASRRGRHLICEVDGQRLILTEARVGRRGYAILSRRVLVPPADEGSAGDAILRVQATLRPRPDALHLILADRSYPRFEMAVPRLGRKALRELMARRVRQEAGLPVSAPVHVGWTKTGRTASGQTAWQVCGLPHAALSGLQSVFEANSVHVGSICLREDAALGALPSHLPSRVAVLDRNRGGVRLIYLQDGALLHERQINLDLDAETVSDAEVERLGFEISRTLDYFAGMGYAPPEALAFAPSLGLDEEAQRAAASELAVFELPLENVQGDSGGEFLDLAPVGVLRHLVGRTRLPLVDFGSAPKPLGARIAAVACVATVAAAGFGGHLIGQETARADEERVRFVRAHKDATAERDALQARLDAARPEDPSAGDGEDRLHAILGQRRPASLLMADVLLAMPRDLVLDRLAMHSAGSVAITGHWRGDDRQDGLAAIRRLRDALRATAYLHQVEEHIRFPSRGAATDGAPGIASTEEDAEASPRLAFQLSATWKGDPQ